MWGGGGGGGGGGRREGRKEEGIGGGRKGGGGGGGGGGGEGWKCSAIPESPLMIGWLSKCSMRVSASGNFPRPKQKWRPSQLDDTIVIH